MSDQQELADPMCGIAEDHSSVCRVCGSKSEVRIGDVYWCKACVHRVLKRARAATERSRSIQARIVELRAAGDPKCPNCGMSLVDTTHGLHGNRVFCSPKCRQAAVYKKARFMRAGEREARQKEWEDNPPPCVRCGKPLSAAQFNPMGRPRMYCSPLCKALANIERKEGST